MKLPKFYNPFKAHIVQFADGKFAVRKWFLIAWEYKEHVTFANDDIYWWNSMEHVKKWCVVDTLEQAKALRDKYKIKSEKVKVIHG
jgi:hypothetical protein